jgi:plasmid stabilization system protein ParE
VSAVARSPVEFHPSTRGEIRKACAWYRERSLAAEDGFLAELRHAVEQASLAPNQWPLVAAGTRRYVFSRYPYSLFYRVIGNTVRVLAVAHDKKREGYWQGRR